MLTLRGQPAETDDLTLPVHGSSMAGRVRGASAAAQKDATDQRLQGMVEQHFDAVWRSLRRLGVPNEAVDDAAQRVFLIAARKLDAIRPDGERPYLLGIAVRVASDARRTLRRRREVSAEEADDVLNAKVDPQPSPEDLVDRKRARELLDRILETMPMELRAAFTMFDIEGMTITEVAVALGTPTGTAASRIRRARELFEKSMRRLGYRREGGSHG